MFFKKNTHQKIMMLMLFSFIATDSHAENLSYINDQYHVGFSIPDEWCVNEVYSFGNLDYAEIKKKTKLNQAPLGMMHILKNTYEPIIENQSDIETYIKNSIDNQNKNYIASDLKISSLNLKDAYGIKYEFESKLSEYAKNNFLSFRKEVGCPLCRFEDPEDKFIQMGVLSVKNNKKYFLIMMENENNKKDVLAMKMVVETFNYLETSNMHASLKSASCDNKEHNKASKRDGFAAP